MRSYQFIRTSIKSYLALLLLFSAFFIFAYADTTSELLEQCPIVTHDTQSKYTQVILENFTFSTKDLKLENDVPIKNLSHLIDAYCASVLSAGQLYDGDLLYSPRQSAFVYLFCTNNNRDFAKFFTRASDAKDVFSANFSGYFKVSDFDKLGLPVDKDKKYLAYLYVDDLFNNIIAEYFTIKQANVYGLLTDDSEKLKPEEQANIFSSLYFNGIRICDASKELWKMFPKTCKYLVQYNKSAAKMFQSLNILNTTALFADYQKLQKFNQEKKPPVSNFCSSVQVLQGDYQIMLCGLWGDLSEKKMNTFINLIYNELFYYNLFVQYFGIRLNKDPLLLKDTTMNDGVGTIKEQQMSRVNQMNTELRFSKQAVSTSLRILRNAYVTFPLHIGFLMYWEGLQEFGKSLAPIATPVYTLYDKFRNVQCIRQ